MANNQNTSWGKVSDWYDETIEKNDSYQQAVILPNLLRIVAPKRGEVILDLGCGTGFFSRNFAEAGAKVIGVDLGAELIDIAKNKSGNLPIKYFVGSADNLSEFPQIQNNFFDTVTIVLALQNMKNLNGVVAEVSKKLKKSGR
jgi:ubiquinone/menaquinone biosynthesis C-methylase UbiE